MIIFRLLPGELLSGELLSGEAGRDAAHGVQQLIAVLLHGDHGDTQCPLHIVQGYVIQKDPLPVAEHIGGDEQTLPQLLPPQLGDQVAPRDQSGHHDGLPEEVVADGIHRPLYFTTFFPRQLYQFR